MKPRNGVLASRRSALSAMTLSAMAAALLALPSSGLSADLPGEGKTVRPGYTGLLEERFQTEVVIIGLERLGYEVEEMKLMDVPALHVATGQGDLDFIAAHWDPLQTAFYTQAGGPDTVTKVGTLVEGCMQGYLIDKRTADEYHITNIDQLRDPEIAKLFDSDGDGKADLAGCPPGWGCERVVEHHMDAYDLRKTVTHRQGQFGAMAADTVTRFKAGERVLYYTYTPLWLSQVLIPGKDVEWLEVPRTDLPEEQQDLDLNTKLPDGRNIGYPVNVMRVMANNEFLAENPAARAWFELVTVPVEDVNAENLKAHEGEDSFEDVRRHAQEWVDAHEEQVSAWLAEAAKAQ
ncbi:MAG: glycine betaine/L-proline ABC transporter substrate-binding protein ProX [Dongiaceae bacterium]